MPGEEAHTAWRVSADELVTLLEVRGFDPTSLPCFLAAMHIHCSDALKICLPAYAALGDNVAPGVALYFSRYAEWQ